MVDVSGATVVSSGTVVVGSETGTSTVVSGADELTVGLGLRGWARTGGSGSVSPIRPTSVSSMPNDGAGGTDSVELEGEAGSTLSASSELNIATKGAATSSAVAVDSKRASVNRLLSVERLRSSFIDRWGEGRHLIIC